MYRNSFCTQWLLSCCLIAMTSAFFSLDAGAQIRVIARSGDLVPGNAGTFASFSTPIIRRSGEIIVVASGGNPNVSRVLRLGPLRGEGRVIVAGGDPAPDADGNFRNDFAGKVFAAETGSIAFIESFQNSLNPQNSFGIVFGGVGSSALQMAVRGVQSVPGSLPFQPARMVGLNDSGQILLIGSNTTEFGWGLWRRTASGLVRIVQPGDPSPGGGNFIIGVLPLSNDGVISFNAQGTAVFQAVNQVGIYAGSQASNLVSIAQPGQSAPSGNGAYSSFGEFPKINDSGAVAFTAIYQNTAQGAGDNEGIVLRSAQGAVELVRKGALLPDANGRFLNPAQAPIFLNNVNDVAFASNITGATNSSNSGLFVYRNGAVRKIVRINDAVPGGGTFASDLTLVGINQNGMVLFTGFYRPTPQDPEFFGIFAFRDNALISIVRENDQLPGFGRISRLQLAPSGGSNKSALNEFNQVAFWLEFQDSSSVFRTGVAVWGLPPGPQAEIQLEYSGTPIANNDLTPSAADGTLFPELNVSGGILERTFEIRNVGQANLNMTGTPIVAVNGADFSVVAQPATIVQPGGLTSFRLRFDPSGSGNRIATVTINNTDEDENPTFFRVAGTGVTGSPEIEVRGNNVVINNGSTVPLIANNTNFGDVAVSGGLRTRSFVIRNLGTAPLLLYCYHPDDEEPEECEGVPPIQFAGPHRQEFDVVTPIQNFNAGRGGPYVVEVVPVNGSTTVTVGFDPNDLGLRSATAQIFSNDSDESRMLFAVQGNGIAGSPGPAPDIEVSGNGVAIQNGSIAVSISNHTDFGTSGSIVDRVFTIRNRGNAPLSLNSTQVSSGRGAPFAIVTQPANSIDQNGFTTFTVRFTGGGRTSIGTVSVGNNDPDEDPTTFRIGANINESILESGFEFP